MYLAISLELMMKETMPTCLLSMMGIKIQNLGGKVGTYYISDMDVNLNLKKSGTISV